MAYEKKILGKLHCPRCNAIAQLRTDVNRQENDTLLVYLVCDKCKLTVYRYSTTRKALEFEERINNMEWKLASLDPTSVAADALRGRIAEARRRHSHAELGL